MVFFFKDMLIPPNSSLKTVTTWCSHDNSTVSIIEGLEQPPDSSQVDFPTCVHIVM